MEDFDGGNLGLIKKHDMNSKPLMRPALALTPLANPRRSLRVLFSMMGCTTAPRQAPDATKVITSARRLKKYCETTAMLGI